MLEEPPFSAGVRPRRNHYSLCGRSPCNMQYNVLDWTRDLVMHAVRQPHRWTRKQYERLVGLGAFDPDQRVELIEGEIVDMAPQKPPHAVALSLLHDALRQAYEKTFVIRAQAPLSLDKRSAPEPDIAVVLGNPRDFLNSHPQMALLVVEIAETTLAYDRSTKLALYARNQISEYWILNLIENTLEVYRAPQKVIYAERMVLKKGESVSPPGAIAVIKVEEILP